MRASLTLNTARKDLEAERRRNSLELVGLRPLVNNGSCHPKLQQRLEDTIMPGIGDHVATSRIMTPDDFVTELNAPFGAAFGPEPTIFQSAWFRPHNVSEEVDNLFLVGAGTHPGAGVPSVITSAKVLDEVIPTADIWMANHAK